MNTILQTIIDTKRSEVKELRSSVVNKYTVGCHDFDLTAKEACELFGGEASISGPLRSFRAALSQMLLQGDFALIAEIKKASPSKGLIRNDFNPPAHAIAYQAGGAACLSVLTDTTYFQGHPDFVKQAKEACLLPILRKDFMIDPLQVAESRWMGADAILIIVAALDNTQMAEIESAAIDQAMEVLVEVHDEHELERALRLKSRLIGVNNRDLRDFSVDLEITRRVARVAPSDCLLVAESGLNTKSDLDAMADHGVRCFLVGESLMRHADVEAATRRLLTGA